MNCTEYTELIESTKILLNTLDNREIYGNIDIYFEKLI